MSNITLTKYASHLSLNYSHETKHVKSLNGQHHKVDSIHWTNIAVVLGQRSCGQRR
ncbi:hypothetical protein PAXRUDRAFT_828571 [Paxillus rubicundulus Ve08.2h10]|uniref:Unplaced genomic scaffold scaffold_327, whole genome shotgun sequence n=1 Tax=Paxillus rubicundulus Ve08.2h10 TaxID=930991 RepID=A0A0D0D9T9_9AGAM|nr:hypothetical protein PAXRUDRAFT_828571 [Paxillus rubicundulus Ve08.2h10]